MESIEITYEGVKFEIEYDYFDPEEETADTPPYDESVTIREVKHKETDFFQLLECDFDTIEALILNDRND
jgi:hypothetical protein